jgi:hypothetical protein
MQASSGTSTPIPSIAKTSRVDLRCPTLLLHQHKFRLKRYLALKTSDFRRQRWRLEESTVDLLASSTTPPQSGEDQLDSTISNDGEAIVSSGIIAPTPRKRRFHNRPHLRTMLRLHVPGAILPIRNPRPHRRLLRHVSKHWSIPIAARVRSMDTHCLHDLHNQARNPNPSKEDQSWRTDARGLDCRSHSRHDCVLG